MVQATGHHHRRAIRATIVAYRSGAPVRQRTGRVIDSVQNNKVDWFNGAALVKHWWCGAAGNQHRGCGRDQATAPSFAKILRRQSGHPV
jgi:hypothetical protein